ncbi:hypothetical protein MPSEU_000275400 [Mayamaea pseudoterrestris]|nr:hypothetical protein MPSEU_000275400 [Mayamaea pseudoterrestris]
MLLIPRKGRYILLFQITALLCNFQEIAALKSLSIDRRMLLRRLSNIATTTLTFALTTSSNAFAFSSQNSAMTSSNVVSGSNPTTQVAYKSFQLPMGNFGVSVPVACWFPFPSDASKSESFSFDKTATDNPVRYEHRISVKRIGQLLAGWNFIPDFTSRKFSLSPGLPKVMDAQNCHLPTSAPLVLLAHGYLGSRFDLSHLAEKLASEGFVCVAAEYPESLAASYDRVEGLTRQDINTKLLNCIQNDLSMTPRSYGIVGHSLGCGTAIDTGDERWARVCIAGFPRRRDGSPIEGNLLFLTSMNDGAVSLARFGGKAAMPSDITVLEETSLEGVIGSNNIPKRAAVIFDRPDAPNHISFLAEGVNDAMIDLLSPLLPVAQSLSIPVLDFDRYQTSRDSLAAANAYQPLVVAYLKQQMKA